MSVVSLPPSFNFAEMKPAASAAGEAVFSKIRSDNSSYSAGDVLRLTIPTGNNMFLSGQDSFISFRFTPTFTNTAGAVRIDGSAYSIIKRLTVYHGSSMIENILNANRLYNGLYDIQSNFAERATGTINLLVDETSGIGTNGYTYGAVMTSGVSYQVSMCLPSILGSFCDKAIPLAWLNAAEIFIEIELESATKVLTTRTADSISGSTGLCTALAVTGYSVSEFYYNACITTLSGDVGNVLKQAMMARPLVIPAVSYRGEQRTISASATAFSDKFSFQFSSMKGIVWWLTNAQTSNGVIAATNLNAAITTRAPGDLDQWWVSLNGQDFPPSHIKAGQETATRIVGAEVLSHLERHLNQVAVPGFSASLTKELYCNSATTYANDTADAKKFVAGLSLDRFDNDNQRQLQGVNTMSAQFQLSLAFTSAIAETSYVYAYGMYDLGLELLDGLLVPRY
jgi:hypothetical protein